MTLDLAGERIDLRADRSVFWAAKKTLILADPHFGKADAFRAAGIPVPGSGVATLASLSNALITTRAERLIVLGDFWHTRSGRIPRVLDELRAWRTQHAELHIDLIRGNHDHAGRPPEEWAATWRTGPMLDDPFVFNHYPDASEHGYVLAGHLHPGVVLHGRGRQRLRLPAFWIAPQLAILPAFGTLTGLQTNRPGAMRTFVIAGNEVMEVRLTGIRTL